MSVTGFLGLRGTGDWSGDERPKKYRLGILKLFPNGDAPLTALQSKGRSQKVDDPEFSYFSKLLAAQSGTCAGVYKETTLSNQYASGNSATAGTTVYAQMAAAVSNHFRIGHTVILIDKDDDTKTSFGRVTAKDTNGASSYVAVKLLAASATGYLNAVDTIDIVGNANAEGAPAPEAISYDATKFTNLTQIFRTPLDITRTQRKTRLRTGDAYLEAKREALLYHGVEMEQAAFFGEKTEGVGANGKPIRTTQGIVSFIRENAEDNDLNFSTSESLTWLQGGEDWIDESLEQVFRYGRDQKMAFCGSGALLGIMKLVKQSGNFELTSSTLAYGIQVNRWTTPFGEILLKRHPLFTFKTHRTNSVVIYEPQNVQFSYIDDTHFKKDTGEREGGYQAYDGTKEEFLTEAGYEWHFPETMMYMAGVGVDGVA